MFKEYWKAFEDHVKKNSLKAKANDIECEKITLLWAWKNFLRDILDKKEVVNGKEFKETYFKGVQEINNVLLNKDRKRRCDL